MNTKIILTLLGLCFSYSSLAQGYYHKGEYIELSDKRQGDKGSLIYSTKDGKEKRLTNQIILKIINHYEADYFEKAYALELVKQYGRTFIFEAADIDNVLDICKLIYEKESVAFAHPSFIKKVRQDKILFENLTGPDRALKPKIISLANEDTKAMLDAEESVNYWKYYDDVFRFKDESFWHLHNRGGFVTQAFYNDEFYDVLSRKDVDTNVLQVIDQGITGKGVKIVVVDSAFDTTHPDLRFSDSYNFYSKNKDATPNSTAKTRGRVLQRRIP